MAYNEKFNNVQLIHFFKNLSIVICLPLMQKRFVTNFSYLYCSVKFSARNSTTLLKLTSAFNISLLLRCSSGRSVSESGSLSSLPSFHLSVFSIMLAQISSRFGIAAFSKFSSTCIYSSYCCGVKSESVEWGVLYHLQQFPQIHPSWFKNKNSRVSVVLCVILSHEKFFYAILDHSKRLIYCVFGMSGLVSSCLITLHDW